MVERRIKAAKFPTVKILDGFDFKATLSLNKILVLKLDGCGMPSNRAADIHCTAYPTNGKYRAVFLDELQPHGFWLAKNTVAFL
ncbi:hypothetical protein A9Q94_17470 [Rhodobacterales bacterium 56_14_T64]|nr:hypothetical protein A9Q94_17470 [Rhodobacterales bacterium 56_14_T64]